MQINIWVFPSSEFVYWRDFVGNSNLESHKEYMTMIAAIQADQERQGRTVKRITMSVSEMNSLLNDSALENTTENRATILATQEA